MAVSAACDWNHGGKLFGKLLSQGPCPEAAPAIANDIDAGAIDAIFRDNLFKRRFHLFYRIEQFLARVLRRKDKKRQLLSTRDQLWDAARFDLLDVVSALIPSMEPYDERVGVFRCLISIRRVHQVVEVALHGRCRCRRHLLGVDRSNSARSQRGNQSRRQNPWFHLFISS
ncbi:hypothetical protein D3C80_1464380 [compost metagenome]